MTGDVRGASCEDWRGGNERDNLRGLVETAGLSVVELLRLRDGSLVEDDDITSAYMRVLGVLRRIRGRGPMQGLGRPTHR